MEMKLYTLFEEGGITGRGIPLEIISTSDNLNTVLIKLNEKILSLKEQEFRYQIMFSPPDDCMILISSGYFFAYSDAWGQIRRERGLNKEKNG